MRVVSVFPTKTFKLILEFEDGTYRLFDIRTIPVHHKSLIADIQFDRGLFLTAAIDSIAGTVKWANGVDFESEMFYRESVDLENLTNIRDFTRAERDTPLTEALMQLKDKIVCSKELTDNYEYFLKHDDINEEEREEAERKINKLKNEISSYQKAISILEAHQNHEKKNHMKKKILDIYKKGTKDELNGILPFSESFYWRFASIVEALEYRRIINELLHKGCSKGDLEKLFPSENVDILINYFNKYKSIEIEQIFEALIVIYKEKIQTDILKRIFKSTATFSDIESGTHLDQILSLLAERSDSSLEIEADKEEVQNIEDDLKDYSNELSDISVDNNDNYKNDIVDNAIAVAKLVLAGKTTKEIFEVSGLSLKYIEKVKIDLLEGTSIEKLMKQFASYKKKT